MAPPGQMAVPTEPRAAGPIPEATVLPTTRLARRRPAMPGVKVATTYRVVLGSRTRRE
jgi:hypothetical protein